MSLLRDVFPSSMGPHSLDVTLQVATALPGGAVRAFATAMLYDSRFGESMLAALDEALTTTSHEYRAIVAQRRDAIVGLIVFGEMAGAVGAGRIYALAVDPSARGRGVAGRLLETACGELAARRARFTMMELPGEPAFVQARRLAERVGFREEGRVDDYVRDGVPLILLRRDLTAP